MTTTALVFLINIFTSLLKRYVYPKYGKFGVQVLAFILAVIAAVYFAYGDGLKVYVTEALVLFSASVAIYEVILSRLSIFKQEGAKVGN